ncbi:hypothetical protein E3N88_21287 [Mikania micrantha]|uniref:Uncharacterized protein n=1 Tax=Mikania micrantha TaxID=192012 RepID=A0A5N6NJT7_9ASTR|nr:hypothetical protein E3N88_21287 [Mikania micrantha]
MQGRSHAAARRRRNRAPQGHGAGRRRAAAQCDRRQKLWGGRRRPEKQGGRRWSGSRKSWSGGSTPSCPASGDDHLATPRPASAALRVALRPASVDSGIQPL